MTTATETPATHAPVVTATRQWALPVRKIGAALLAALPGLLTLYLSFNAGGYFAGATGVAVAVLAGVVMVRMAVVRDPFSGFSRPLQLAIASLAFYSIWCLISSRWSHAPARALLDFDLANVYLFALILFGSTSRSHRRVRWTMILTWIAMLGVCIASLATRLRPDLFPIPLNVSPGRLSFPLTYWNALGVFAAIGLLIAVHLASSTREPRAMRVFATAVTPVFAVTVLLTYSRGALIVGALGLVAYALLARPRGLPSALLAGGPASAVAVIAAYNARLISNAGTSAAAVQQGRQLTTTIVLCCAGAAIVRAALLGLDTRVAAVRISAVASRRSKAVILGACAAALIAAALGFHGRIATEWTNFTKTDRPVGLGDVRNHINSITIGSRLREWRVALHVFEHHPVDGHGAGTFGMDWYRLRPDSGLALQTHSLYLQAVSELGLIGLAAILATIGLLIGACFVRARRGGRSLWIALGVVALVWAVHAGVDDDWQMPALTLPVFALASAALARRGAVARMRPRTEIVLRVAVGLIALGAAITALRIAVSDNHLSDSVVAFNSGSCHAAIADANASIAAVPSRPEPYAIIGYCDVLDRRPKSALVEMKSALSREPGNWLYIYGLAVADAAAGRNPGPRLVQAEKLNPLDQMLVDASISFKGHNRTRWRRAAVNAEMPVSMRQ